MIEDVNMRCKGYLLKPKMFKIGMILMEILYFRLYLEVQDSYPLTVGIMTTMFSTCRNVNLSLHQRLWLSETIYCPQQYLIHLMFGN